MNSFVTRSKGVLVGVLATGGLLLGASGAAQATDVGVSISIGQPGFYGNIDIGDYPRPQVIYAEPRIIRRERVTYQPVYIRVPPGHEKHWDKHCDRYNACGRPVYFVQDSWYENVYVPAYRERHRDSDRRYYSDNNNHQGNDNDQGGNYKSSPGNSGGKGNSGKGNNGNGKGKGNN